MSHKLIDGSDLQKVDSVNARGVQCTHWRNATEVFRENTQSNRSEGRRIV